jgi:hypothetical protein
MHPERLGKINRPVFRDYELRDVPAALKSICPGQFTGKRKIIEYGNAFGAFPESPTGNASLTQVTQ